MQRSSQRTMTFMKTANCIRLLIYITVNQVYLNFNRGKKIRINFRADIVISSFHFVWSSAATIKYSLLGIRCIRGVRCTMY